MSAVTGELSTSSQLYVQLQCYYSRQMQLLDGSKTTEWAATFTEDGIFAANAQPEPVQGRQAIAAAAARARAALKAAGVMHRHWLGMLDVELLPDGTVRAGSYALVVETPRSGSPIVKHSTRCDDILVPRDGSWLVSRRMVTRDDLV